VGYLNLLRGIGMAIDIKTVEEEALKLPVGQRATLAQHLLASLDDLDEGENERLWVAEAEGRYQAYKNGELPARDALAAVAEARKRL
jgi:hypothetical protein